MTATDDAKVRELWFGPAHPHHTPAERRVWITSVMRWTSGKVMPSLGRHNIRGDWPVGDPRPYTKPTPEESRAAAEAARIARQDLGL